MVHLDLPAALAAATWLHWVSAAGMLVIFTLYVWRSVRLYRRPDVEQDPAAVDYRRGLAVLLACFTAALAGRAAAGTAVEWFHLLVLAAQVYTIRAMVRLGGDRSPT